MTTFKNLDNKYKHKIVKWRRDLHQIPEIGFELPQTTKYIIKELKKLDIEVLTNEDDLGVVGLIKGDGEKTIAIRSDMDALPIEEETVVNYKSTNGNMHACGHDAHMAMVLGAANLLIKNKNKLNGNVKLIFQPAEETTGGAKPMIEKGVLKNPKVDSIIGLHAGNLINGLKSGQIGVSDGHLMASTDEFIIKIIGNGGHGANPDESVDPIVMAGHVILSLQNIVSREIKPTETAVLSIGKIQGGSVFNVIPNTVELVGTIRTFSEKNRKNIIKRIKEIVSATTKAFNGDFKFERKEGYPTLVNDKDFTKKFLKSANKILDKNDIVKVDEPIMGGEDFAYFLKEVPGTFFMLYTNNEEKGITKPNHNSKFNVDEEVLWKGSALLAQTSLDWLNNN